MHFQIPFLKEKLAEKEQQLNEIGQKYSLNKQILTENWHQAATEVRRQYEAIDSALEVSPNQSLERNMVSCQSFRDHYSHLQCEMIREMELNFYYRTTQ
jgi:hypothetical protein